MKTKKFLLLFLVALTAFMAMACKKEYKIGYDLDGGTCSALVETFAENETVTLPTPTKEGYSFDGWYEGDIKITAIVNKDYNLVAKWIKIYTITYDLDGGTCTGLVESYQEGGSVTLPTPTKSGYTFSGWYEGTTKVESITNGSKDYALKAQWIEDKPKITSITISGAKDAAVVGEELQLTVDVTEKVTWSANDPTLVQLTTTANSNNVTVKFVKAGTVVLTCTLDSDTTVTAKVTVNITVNFQNVKDTEKRLLSNWFNIYSENEYSETNWAQIQKILTDALAAIDTALTEEEIAKIVNDAKSNSSAVLDIATELEDNLRLKREAATKELNDYKASLTQSDYTAINFNKISSLIVDATNEILFCNDLEEIDEIVTSTKLEIDAVEKILIITYVNAENSYWGYQSYDEIVEDFKTDYVAYTGNSLYGDDGTYVDIRWQGSSANVLKVFTESNGKWLWLLDYWASVNNNSFEGNKNADVFRTMKNSLVCSNPYFISTEIHAFITLSSKFVSGGGLKSADYSLEETRENILSFCFPSTTYEKGSTYTIPTPTREFQEFLGWYTTADFSGEAFTAITEDMNESITLYAKWSEISAENQFILDQRAAKQELKEYLDTFDMSLYSAAKQAELKDLLAKGQENIDKTTTQEELAQCLVTEKDKLDAVLPSVYAVEYELNGGHWYYQEYDEMTAEFFSAYAKFKSSVTVDNFFSTSYAVVDEQKITAFFKTHSEWAWVLDYLASLATEEAKVSFNINSLNEPLVRINIQGMLTKTFANHEDTYIAFDFSSEEVRSTALDYCVQKQFTYVEVLDVLPAPYKAGYLFDGWYTEATFENKVTTADQEITLYAKWIEITDEVQLNLNKEAAKDELDAYLANLLSDETKYTQDNKTVLTGIVDKAKEDIDKVTSTDEDIVGATAILAIVDVAKADMENVPTTDIKVTFVLNGGTWNYSTREEMVEDFVTDAMAYFDIKGSRPNAMVGDSQTGKVGFADKFSERIHGIFVSEEYGAKWSWMKEYILSKSADSVLTNLNNTNDGHFETYWRYSVAAFLYKDIRTNWPYSADYTTEEMYDGFWSLEIFTRQTFDLREGKLLPTNLKKADNIFAGWYATEDLSGDAVTSVNVDTTLYAKWVSAEVKDLVIEDVDALGLNAVFTENNKAADFLVIPNLEVGNYKLVNTNLNETNAALQLLHGAKAFKTLAEVNKYMADNGLTNQIIYVFSGNHAGVGELTQANTLVYGPNIGVAGQTTRVAEAVLTTQLIVRGNGTTLNGLKFTDSGQTVLFANDVVITNCYVAPTTLDNSCFGNNRKGCIVDGQAITNLKVLNTYICAPGEANNYTNQFMSFTNITGLEISGCYITNVATTLSGDYAGMRIYHLGGIVNITDNEFRFATNGYVFYIGGISNSATQINIIDNIFAERDGINSATLSIRNGTSALTTTIRGNQFINFNTNTFGFNGDTGSTVNITYNFYNHQKNYQVGTVASAKVTTAYNCYMGTISSTDKSGAATEETKFASLEELQAAYLVAYPEA